jgi:hypothetical protein
MEIKTFGFGHSTAEYLNQVGLLNSLFLKVVNDKYISQIELYKVLRQSRSLDKYYFNL